MTDLNVLVVSAMYPSDDDPVRGVVVRKEVEALRAAGLTVGVIPKRPGWRGYITQARLLLAHAGRADVIHAHYGTSGFVAALFSGSTPLVVTMHGSDIALGPRPQLSKYWIQYLLSVVGAARAAKIVVQDDTMVQQLPQRLRGRTSALGQAVRLPEVVEQTDRSGVLFLSSRHRSVKRFPLAEEAMNLLPKAGQLDSLDRHPVADIPRAMETARVGLLTSEREGMPVAVKEALAAGLRVVAVDLPGLRSLAEEVPHAVVLTGHDPASIAAAVNDALQAPPLTTSERADIHGVLRRRGWTEPDRTRTLVAEYRRLSTE
ncbi:MAG: glycosyltransferase [Mobilicoccus sp.]|nr:glycosyltransferase [Mobilicoccus sp.]